MKKILLSLSMMAVVAVAVAGATGAFFSDTETSTGNTFTAGAIDLKIDNQSYVTAIADGQGYKEGDLIASPTTSWTLADLTNQLFFNFQDVKPGDVGEDTISIHVDNNDAYICMDVTLTATPENGQNEPEAKDDNTAGATEGELQNALKFAWWADDGDNVYETGETIFKTGTAADLFVANQTKWALADTATNVWGAVAPVPGGSTRYIAKFWCMGDMAEAAVQQDGQTTSGPLARGTGFTCSGATLNNATQTDGISVDVTFEAVQSRNNKNFLCNPVVTPQ